jgi:hypothetical protein
MGKAKVWQLYGCLYFVIISLHPVFHSNDNFKINILTWTINLAIRFRAWRKTGFKNGRNAEENLKIPFKLFTLFIVGDVRVLCRWSYDTWYIIDIDRPHSAAIFTFLNGRCIVTAGIFPLSTAADLYDHSSFTCSLTGVLRWWMVYCVWHRNTNLWNSRIFVKILVYNRKYFRNANFPEYSTTRRWFGTDFEFSLWNIGQYSRMCYETPGKHAFEPAFMYIQCKMW